MLYCLVLLLGLLVTAGSAHAQVIPSGSFTPGHTIRCQNSTCTVVVDAGGSAGSNKSGQGYLTELGITNTGTPLCINDALTNAAGGYHQLCIGANALGGGLISYNAYGGASSLPFQIGLNNVLYPFPGTGNGNVIGPTSPAPNENDVVVWNGNTAVRDSNTVILTPLGNGQDDVPQFTDAVTSGKHVIALGTFNFASSTVPSHPAYGPFAVIIKNQSNFILDLSGATLTNANSITTGNTGLGTLFFDGDSNFKVIGGNFVGNQTGKVAGGDTVAMGFYNSVNGYMDHTPNLSGDWQSLGGVGVDGDWDVHLTFDHPYMPNVSKCFDIAFQYGTKIDHLFATGEYQGDAGVTCVGITYDAANDSGSNNQTGYSFSDNLANIVSNSEASGFNTGWVISSGSYYTLANNIWHDNYGSVSNATAGFGGIVGYFPSGNQTSVGHPPSYITVTGDQYNNNGNASDGGGGIQIQSNNISNSDTLSHVHVIADMNNNYTAGFWATSASNMSDITANLSCSGLNQSECQDNNTLNVSYLKSVITSNSAIGLTSGSGANITSLNLGPGTWEIWGAAGIVTGSGTTATSWVGCITTASAACAEFPGAAGNVNQQNISITSTQTVDQNISPQVFSFGTTTTVYMVMASQFSGGTTSGFGSVYARQLR